MSANAPRPSPSAGVPARLAELAARRRGLAVGHRIDWFAAIGSTNDHVRAELARGAPAGLVAVADEQTAGRGRAGRTWTAPAGSGLLVTVGLTPDLRVSAAWRIGAWLALAAADAIGRTTGLDAALKWPNDVLVHGRKVGGILVETVLRGDRIAAAVAGLGLNVDVPADLLAAVSPDATSLTAELGGGVDRFAVLDHLLDGLNASFAGLTPPAETAADPLRDAWTGRLATLGQPIWLHERGGRRPATAVAVASDGGLVIRSGDGGEETVYAADVSIRARTPDPSTG